MANAPMSQSSQSEEAAVIDIFDQHLAEIQIDLARNQLSPGVFTLAAGVGGTTQVTTSDFNKTFNRIMATVTASKANRVTHDLQAA